MVEAGIRDVKNNLSRYIRRVEAGERIAVTAHGRVVAEIWPAGTRARRATSNRIEQLIDAGVARPPLESGDPLAGLPARGLAAGTAARLLDEDRDEA
jgi:prevent-host-death family protein